MSTTAAITFEGVRLISGMHRGQLVWGIKSVGLALGYSSGGRRLVSNVMKDWSSEFVIGQDYDILSGQDLVEFRASAELVSENGTSPFAASLAVFTEQGLNKALLLTKKRRGKLLRDYFATEVMPQLARDGQYSPEREVVDNQIVEAPGGSVGNDNQMRMRELDLEWERLQLESRRFQIETMERAIECHPSLAPESIAALRASCVEIATGSEQKLLKPAIGNGWKSPTELGQQWDLSANRIGRIISALKKEDGIDLKAMPEMSMQIMSKSQSSDRNVQPYIYSPAAEKIIYTKLVAQGHAPEVAAQ